MPQYTSTQTTRGGAIVNAVLDTATNTITYTLTTPTGATATTTLPATEDGNKSTNLRSLIIQIESKGPTTSLLGIASAVSRAGQETKDQAGTAEVEARRSGNPPPAESAPIPVAPTNNPNTTPAPSVPPVENATTPATGQNAATNAAFLDANAEPQQLVDPNTDPNTNIGNDSQEQPPQPQQTISLASDPNTNIGAEAQTPTPQQPINPNTDPNTNIGTEGQDLVYDPLQEPPITNDGDEFSGIDEQVQRQKDLEDGSLEFAGIDDQIAANENALQEPPLLSDEEIDQQLRLAAQGDQIENETPADITTEDPFEAARQAAEERGNEANTQAAIDAVNQSVPQGISTALNDTRSTATKDDSASFQQKPDWRARLSLSPGANYLYKVEDGKAGILGPLQATDGVIFPYTPAISVTYSAGYDASDLIHSNYKVYQYKGSSVDTVSITADFTAQDTTEANYLLAVIHFFRSATKMFYGEKDSQRGTPPPLVYLFGLGQYQFQAHPCVIRSFNYNLPSDVDYIRTKPNNYNVNFNNTLPKTQGGNNPISAVFNRLRNALLPKGAIPNVPQELLTVSQSVNNIDNSTYVPTKITVQISLLPIQTRNQQSQQFSVKEFASGNLLKGGFW